ncbi:MAG: hypothetical protein ACK5LN_05940 [Propioniciclava sp.]
MTHSPRPHRPVVREPAALEAIGVGSDPIAELHAAHETAAVLLRTGRAADDPAVVARLVALVDALGIETLADLWATRPAQTLPGALWRLYVLREWVTSRPDNAARDYAAGAPVAEAEHAVAGADPAGPEEVRRVIDEVLRGVFTGDFAVALERAAAFCRVVSTGRTESGVSIAGLEQAWRLRDLANDLGACAQLWRNERLH